MNNKISGLLRQADQKRIQIRILAFVLISGFVFSGAAEFASLPHSDEHSMTQNTADSNEQGNISQILSTQTEMGGLLLDSQQENPVVSLLNAKSVKEKQEQEFKRITEKQIKFLKELVDQMQKIILTLDFEAALAAHGEENQQKNTEEVTEKDNAENNLQTPGTTRQAVNPANDNVTTTKAPVVITTASATTEPTTQAETTTALETTTAAADDRSNWEYIGTRKVTGYTPDPAENGGWDVTCRGIKLNTVIGQCVAINTIPLGTKIYIEGIGYRTVMDVGSGNVVDVLVSSKSESYKVGNSHRNIWIIH